MDPNKIYALAVDMSSPGIETVAECLKCAVDDFGLRFVVVPKGSVEFISVPEGYEITKK